MLTPEEEEHMTYTSFSFTLPLHTLGKFVDRWHLGLFMSQDNKKKRGEYHVYLVRGQLVTLIL
jgi:hypothetical protein